jgi:Protein of unknown function (DUF3237)
MIGLEYEMTYAETIEGPLGPDERFPARRAPLLTGHERNLARAAHRRHARDAGTDWIRLGPDGIRRQDLRAQPVTQDGDLILFRYDLALIRSSERFLAALASGQATEFDDQYMRMAPQFEVGVGRYAWLGESLFVGRGRLTGPKALAYELYRVV